MAITFKQPKIQWISSNPPVTAKTHNKNNIKVNKINFNLNHHFNGGVIVNNKLYCVNNYKNKIIAQKLALMDQNGHYFWILHTKITLNHL